MSPEMLSDKSPGSNFVIILTRLAQDKHLEEVLTGDPSRDSDKILKRPKLDDDEGRDEWLILVGLKI